MNRCPTFAYGKSTGQIRTLRCRCELEGSCNGSNCKYIPENYVTVIADDPQDAAQDAVLVELIGQNVRAAISAIAPQ